MRTSRSHACCVAMMCYICRYVYFAVVSFTTIGFGDLSLNLNTSRLFFSITLLLGLLQQARIIALCFEVAELGRRRRQQEAGKAKCIPYICDPTFVTSLVAHHCGCTEPRLLRCIWFRLLQSASVLHSSNFSVSIPMNRKRCGGELQCRWCSSVHEEIWFFA